MGVYKLQHKEAVILKSKNVSHNFGGFNIDEIMLTNQNLVWTKIGMFGILKTPYVFPLSKIVVFNGKVQALVGKHRTKGTPMLDVYLENGDVHQFGFQFNTKRAQRAEIYRWINALQFQIMGDERYPSLENVEDDDSIIGQIKDIGNELKEAFWGPSPTPNTIQPPIPVKPRNIRVSLKCRGCGAQISDFKGRVVKCEYCDTDNQL